MGKIAIYNKNEYDEAEDKGRSLQQIKDMMFTRALIVAALQQLKSNVPIQLSTISARAMVSVEELRDQLPEIMKMNPDLGDYDDKDELFTLKKAEKSPTEDLYRRRIRHRGVSSKEKVKRWPWQR